MFVIARVIVHTLMRRAAGAGLQRPLTIIGPPPLSKWLKTYASFDSVLYELVHNSRFHPGKEWVGAGPREVLKGLLADDLQVDIVTVPVRHSCRDACAIVISSREERPDAAGKPLWKIACSGDTRPCQALVDAVRHPLSGYWCMCMRWLYAVIGLHMVSCNELSICLSIYLQLYAVIG